MIGSIYRYRTGTDHKRSAVVIKDGQFLEVKAPGLVQKKVYSNGDAWVASFVEGDVNGLFDTYVKEGIITCDTSKGRMVEGSGPKSLVKEKIPTHTKDLQKLFEIYLRHHLDSNLVFSVRKIYDNNTKKYITIEMYRIREKYMHDMVYVTDKRGDLHQVVYNPRRGVFGVIGYKEATIGNNWHGWRTVKVATRFCDISDDFGEDAMFYKMSSRYDDNKKIQRLDYEGHTSTDPTKKYLLANMNRLKIEKIRDDNIDGINLVHTFRKPVHGWHKPLLNKMVYVPDFGYSIGSTLRKILAGEK